MAGGGGVNMEQISLSAIWEKASKDDRDVFIYHISRWARNFDRSLDHEGECEILLHFIDSWATTYKPHMTHYMREMNCYWVGDKHEE